MFASFRLGSFTSSFEGKILIALCPDAAKIHDWFARHIRPNARGIVNHPCENKLLLNEVHLMSSVKYQLLKQSQPFFSWKPLGFFIPDQHGRYSIAVHSSRSGTFVSLLNQQAYSREINAAKAIGSYFLSPLLWYDNHRTYWSNA